LGGKGKGETDKLEEDLESVSGGPGDEGAAQLESGGSELNLDGKESASDIMKALQEFEG